jgi:4a-hydroxytetrahydrobiopterin dehydratase
MDDSSGVLKRAAASAALPTWRNLLGRMHLSVATGDFATALALVDRVGAIAEEQGHHPEIDLRWGRVHIATGSHDVGGVTERDIRPRESHRCRRAGDGPHQPAGPPD